MNRRESIGATKNIHMFLPADLYNRAKIFAALAQQTFTDAVIESLNLYIAKNKERYDARHEKPTK